MPLNPGQILNNRYRIVRLLGQGGFGAVYKAWDLSFEVVCAIKENFDTTAEAQRQFLREARLLHVLRHPNLPQVKDHFAIPGQGQYLVMDFVEGQDLEELRLKAGGQLPEAQVLPWMQQVLDALEYLHSQKPPVIHRDIKPANIKITPDGKAMLVDFGIAKTYDPQLKTTLGARAVTPGFSPIEQYGTGVTDARTDIYALGATLYTVLIGQEPPEAPQRTLRDRLIPPRQLNPAVSPAVEAALLHALRVDPEQRCQSAGEFRGEISGQLAVGGSHLTAGGSQYPVVAEAPASTPLTAGNLSPSPFSSGKGGGVSTNPSPLFPVPIPAAGAKKPKKRHSPWMWVGLSIGVLAGLVIATVLWIQSAQDDARWHAEQTSQAQSLQIAQVRSTQTAQALVNLRSTYTPVPPSLTPTSSPLPPSPTAAIPRSADDKRC